MERRFRDWGYTGAFVTIAYYRYDTGCTASLGADGSHARHYGVAPAESSRGAYAAAGICPRPRMG